jgi:outer membrane receptor protein involved in Fe transport
MLKRLLFIPALLLSFGLFAQTGSVSGVVTDSNGGESLIGATVILKGTSKGTIADLEGKFSIPSVPIGEQTIQISFVGYETKEISVSVTADQDSSIGEISLASESVGLDEVRILADIVEERKTPVAISTISAEVLNERFSSASLADAVQNTPGVYSIQGAGGYGDQEVYIRGFDQTNVAFLVNGIPVNDMENGRMFWSNFAGLSQVTRTTQVQRGLGASKLAVRSIGGTMNMITKPADRSEGGRLEYQTGTGSWNNRLRFSYNTGLSDNGWAMSFQGTRTTTAGLRSGQPLGEQGSIVPGAYTDAWSYYISASKKINSQHTLMFWAFGAPTNRGTAWSASDFDREVFDIDQPFYNGALGIKNGEVFNARQNNTNKPLMALTHYWDIDENTNISTSVYYSRARVSSTQPRVREGAPVIFNATADTPFEADWIYAENAQADNADVAFIRGFFPVRLPGMIGSVFNEEGLIDWDYLMAQNRSDRQLVTVPFPNGDVNTPSVTGYNSNFYLESRHNDHDWIGLVSNYTKQMGDLRLRVGIDGRYYKGRHYARVADVMGGDFIINQDEKGFVFNKLDTENAIAYEGDLTHYNYDGNVNWISGFAQGEWIKNDFIFFGSATVTYSGMYRVGHFWYGRADSDEAFDLTSLGKSEVRTSLSYTLKTGANYKIDGRHNVYANAGFFTRPPFFRNAFFDARYSGQYREGLEDEKIYSTELGYGFKAPFLKVNVNAYYLLWTDRTTTFDFEGATEPVPLSLTGMVSEHKGVEVDFVANPTRNLEINGYLGLGDWFWKEVPSANIVREDGSISEFTALDQLEGLPVGTAAQTTAGLGLHYNGIKSAYVGARLNYADRIPIRYFPEDVISGFITADVIESQFDDYATVDLYLGRYFDIGKDMDGRISFSVNNLFDTEYVRWASYSFSQTNRGFGYTRTYTIGLYVNF